MLLETPRLLGAGAILLAYGVFCLLVMRQHRQRQALAALRRGASIASDTWLIAYASQSGQAQELAERSAHSLQQGGLLAQTRCLNDLDSKTLQESQRIVFVVSTWGEGEAPENAQAFVRQCMQQHLDLRHLQVAVLALGDASYAKFCGFGRQLTAWLATGGAKFLHPMQEVDRLQHLALQRWYEQLVQWGGRWHAAPEHETSAGWILQARTCLNPQGSAAPLYHLVLQPAANSSMRLAWQAGDLVQISLPTDSPAASPVLRDYSIASIPTDTGLELLVRERRHADGSLGLASAYLCHQLAPGHALTLRIRPHPGFRLQENAQGRLIFIASGSGLAGVLSLLKARIAAGEYANWLLYGERQAAHDFHFKHQIQAWQAAGQLARLDMAFSRDVPARYVQHALLAASRELRAWIADGAAIYVCGSLRGMGQEVDGALLQMLGEQTLAQLQAEGRYRRDLY